MIPLGPKPNTVPGTYTTGSSGTLVGGSFADSFYIQGIDISVRVMFRDARESAVHYQSYTINCQ